MRPALEPHPSLERYMLLTPWTFTASGHRFTIPVGFTYDGASIPKGAWYTTYSPFNPIVMIAALEHDWLCVQRPKEVPSDAAARHFRDQLHHAGSVRRWLMYQAVLRFGPRWS